MGSGMSSRRGAGPFLGISALLLGAVAAAGLLAVAHARGVEGAAHDLVADAGQVLHPAAADEHDGVLLQVVTHAGDAGGDLDPARQADTGDLAQGRVWLLLGGRVHAGPDPSPLGRALAGPGLAP